MVNSFIDLKISHNNLESYIIRNEIFKTISKKRKDFNGKVLDSGCGSMPYRDFILQNKKVVNYVGLDIDTGLSYGNVKADFLWDGVVMPFQDNSFDVLISKEVLEHVPDLIVIYWK